MNGKSVMCRSAMLFVPIVMFHAPVFAQQAPAPPSPDPQNDAARDSAFHRTALLFAGAATALVAHEAGHLVFDIVFDADPGLKRVEFNGLPFFALTHQELSPRQELIVSSAGFWVQHATNEWILTRRPNLRREHAPFAKGMLTFNVLTSIAYSGVAFARAGPVERDTRGIADSARVDERWVGVMVLAPAVLDAWRYFQPESKLATWMSRGAKVAMVCLVFR